MIPPRFASAALLGALLFSSSTPARADGVLAPANQVEPSILDVQVAIGGGARWTRLQAHGPTRVLWLVPAGPGAAIDWAPETWLDALDDATAPRVVPADAVPPCGAPSGSERVATHGTIGVTAAKGDVLVHATESDVRAHAAARGFAVSPAMASRIAQIYASGTVLASVEVDTTTTKTTRTLRVTGNSGAMIPLALTGSANAAARVTAFVIGNKPVTADGATEITGSQLVWGRQRSTYRMLRDTAVGAGSWVRESASHAPLFDGFSVRTEGSVAPAAYGYLGASCFGPAKMVASTSGPIGRTCAPGAVANVPGGAPCADDLGNVESLRCGSSIDLALALQGLSPSAATITRLSGSIPRGGLGDDLYVSSSTEVWPLVVAGSYEVCGGSSGGIVTPSDPVYPSDPDPDPGSSGGASVFVVTHESCSGDTTSTTTDEPDGTESETTSSSGCSGDTTTTSTSSESGSSDDSSTCSGDSSSSQKSSSDDGWDTEDSDSSSSSKDSCGSSSSDAGAKTTAKKRPSKVSRYAMLLAFIVLPLRRRLRRFR